MDNTRGGLLLLGGGGHCKSVLCALLNEEIFTKIGVVDTVAEGDVLGIPIVGTDDDLPMLRAQYESAFVTVGSIGNTQIRRRLYEMAKNCDYKMLNIIDPTAVISPYAILGQGVFVGKRAVVNAGARIGDGVILNTGCIVEHDDIIGDFVHIAPGAVLGGGVSVGHDVHIGSNVSVIQGRSIGAGSIIGAGSVVIRDVPAGIVGFGNPCREIRKNGNNNYR